MAEDIIATLDFDGSPALATIDEIIAALEQLSEAASAVGDSAGGMTSLDDILTAIQANTDATAAGFDQLASSLSSITDVSDTAAVSLQGVDVALTEMASSGIEQANAGLEALDVEMQRKKDDAEGMGAALEKAQGPLMMLGGAGIMAGIAFLKMGSDGQKGEALLRGMAGASQDDINALQDDALKLGVGMKEASSGFYMVESAGYTGSAAIKVFDATMRLAIGGQAQAADVMTGATAIMHDYGYTAQQVTQVTDKMAETQFLGKQSMQDLATSIGPLAAAGHKAGMGLNEVLAAEATMTQVNPHVRQDTMQLAAMFDSLDPKMGKVQATAKKLKLSFDEQHYASLSLLGKLQYLAQIAGGVTTPAFAKLVGGVRGATAASDIMMGKAGTFKDFMNGMAHSTGRAQYAFEQYEDTIPAALGHVSAAISIFATKLMDALGPVVIPVIHKVADMFGYLVTHMNVAIPVFIGIATVFGVLVVGAVVAMLVALGPVVLIVGGIALAFGAAAVAITLAVQHWGDIVDWFTGKVYTAKQKAKELSEVKHITADKTNLQKQLDDILSQEKHAHSEAEKESLLHEAHLLKIKIQGDNNRLAQIRKQQATEEEAQKNAWQRFVDHFQEDGDWLNTKIHQIVATVEGWFSDLGKALHGWWDAVEKDMEYNFHRVGQGFDALGTHIHDAITTSFNWLVGKFTDLFKFIQNVFTILKNSAFNWMIDFGKSLLNGLLQIPNMIGGALGNIASKIASVLHFSKPDEGPLAEADQWMPDFGDLLTRGLQQQVSKVRGASLNIAAGINIAPGGAASSNNQVLGVLVQILGAIQQGNQQQGSRNQIGPLPTNANYAAINQYITQGQAQQSLQSAYQQLNIMAGRAFEQGLRGANAGLG